MHMTSEKYPCNEYQRTKIYREKDPKQHGLVICTAITVISLYVYVLASNAAAFLNATIWHIYT